MSDQTLREQFKEVFPLLDFGEIDECVRIAKSYSRSQVEAFVAHLKEITAHSVNRGMNGQVMIHELFDEALKSFNKEDSNE